MSKDIARQAAGSEVDHGGKVTVMSGGNMYIYVLRKKANSNAPIKIGKAKDPVKRLKGLQTGNPEKLRIIHLVKCRSEMHSRSIEQELHSRLKKYKMTGEWYKSGALGKFREILDSMNYFDRKRYEPATKGCWTL